jgi:hypothetical protein
LALLKRVAPGQLVVVVIAKVDLDELVSTEKLQKPLTLIVFSSGEQGNSSNQDVGRPSQEAVAHLMQGAGAVLIWRRGERSRHPHFHRSTKGLWAGEIEKRREDDFDYLSMDKSRSEKQSR